MDPIFRFIGLLVGSHLIVGCALTLLAALLLRSVKTNAATRHNVWLGVFALLLFMPLLALLTPPVEPTRARASTAQSTSEVAATDVLGYTSSGAVQQPSFALQATSPRPLLSADVHSGSNGSLFSRLGLAKEVLGRTMGQLPWRGFGLLFSLLVILGIALRSLLFIRSYRNLRSLYHRSSRVYGREEQLCRRLVRQMGLKRPPLLTHSEEVRTPLSSGILRGWIVLPSRLMLASQSGRELQQILLHELAHIRRRDPLVASVQAFVSIFLFWHPAIYYVNRQIRFERELAADDCVLAFVSKDDSKPAQAYAKSLLNIAQSLRSRVSTTHSVACVHSSQGLRARIRNLLDKKINHSTTPQRLYSAALCSVLALSLVSTAPLWPGVPRLESADPVGQPSPGLPHSSGARMESSTGIDEEGELLAGMAEPSRSSVEDVVRSDELQSSTVPVAEAQRVEPIDSERQQPAADIDLYAVTDTLEGIPDLDLSTRFAATAAAQDDRVKRELDSRIDQPVLLLADVTAQFDKDETVDESAAPMSAQLPAALEPEHSVPADLEHALAEEAVDVPTEAATQQHNFLTALLSSASLAANASSSATRDSSVESDPVTVDSQKEPELIVIEDLSRSELLREIVKVQDEYYRVFNANIMDKELRVQCGDYMPTASYIYRRYCEPTFVAAARSENIYQSFVHDRLPTPSYSLVPDLTPQFEQFTSETNSLIRKNAYFRELNRTLRLLKGRLDELS